MSTSAPPAQGAPTHRNRRLLNGLTLLVVLAIVVGLVIAYRIGIVRGRRESIAPSSMLLRPAVTVAPPPARVPDSNSTAAVVRSPAVANINVADPAVAAGVQDEQARLIRALTTENAALRRTGASRDAQRIQLETFAEDRRSLLRELATTRGETARYRDIVIDLEDNAMPALLDGPRAPDDLKLIVGVGPVLERMLHQLGVNSYRQIARWNERDIDEFDARLPEFPGRIRRDGWVTQARSLHLSKYGDAPPAR